MPYRRLPKTDKARVRTLKSILEMESNYSFQNVPLSYNFLNKAKTQFSLFEHHQKIYIETYQKWHINKTKLRAVADTTRLYISHFIQVYNMAVLRGEYKQDGKNFYNLSSEINTLPNLNNEESLIRLGENLIEGERQRMSQGGAPMTNPTISALRVHYNIFKEMRTEQQFLQIAIHRTKENLNIERAKIDQLIKEIWDEIENNFSQLPPDEKIAECIKCGVIYYYRNGEIDSIDAIDEEMDDYEKSEIDEETDKKSRYIKELPFD